MCASSGLPATRGARRSCASACSSIECTSVRYLVSCSSRLRSVMKCDYPATDGLASRPMRRIGVLLAAAALLAGPASARADKTVEALTVWRFDASTYQIDQGEKVVFKNSDAVSPGKHNVTATASGPDGKPLFASATIGNGEQAPVVGADRLKTGEYDFICTIHPFMQATLKVSANGTPAGSEAPSPAPSPAQPADTTAPRLSAALRNAS